MKIATLTRTVKPVVTAVLQSTGPSEASALVKKEPLKLAIAILNAKIICFAGTLHRKIVLLTRKNA